jgi:GrpB-like predicted nucleotidyltransferase (UPF0157 family)/uncharacterized protein (DUF952 family)
MRDDMAAPPVVFHITTAADWEQAQRAGVYEHASLADEGFIHFSDVEQVVRVADRVFRGTPDLVLLCVASARVEAPLQYEHVEEAGERFPHLRGPLNLDAVVEAVPLVEGPDGFALPPRAAAVREQGLAAVTIGPLDRHDGPVTLVEPDPRWPELYEREAARIRGALGDRVLRIEHVGSTSVPGLIAKPIVDIALVVPDPGDEADYAAALTAAGYRLRIRTPEWEEHRMFKGPDTDVNVHVFGPGSAEVERMVRFRDRLRADADARERYAHEKRALAGRRWAHVQYYADAKGPVVEEILAGAP